jgi:DNA-binding CsgD family transcriptional regulator
MTTDAGGSRFTRFRSDKGDPGSLSDDIARAVLVDRAGNLWVGTHGGGLNRLDPDTGKFFHFRHDAADPSSLNSDFIFCLHEDREGAIWAGTLGGGLNRLDMERGTFTHFTTRDGLASNLVLGILEDRAGDLWLTTSEGLSRFSPQQKQFRNYDASDGIQGQGFFGGSVHASQEGELFVCGADGINAFFPQEILDNGYLPPVRITSFKVMNREKQLPRPIWETAEVVLRPDDYLFSLEFAALDYSYPQKNRYAYRLDGLTREWIYTGARNRVASFSTLAPGRYVFRVRGSNGDGVWNPQETTLVIRVLTPWWRSGWFLSLLLAAAVLAGYEWNRTRIRRRARQVRTEQAMEQLFDRCAVSPREREIARLLLKGLNNKEIGERLFIELGTVKIHVHNVLRKLGVRNRTQLLRLFQNLKT